MLPDEPRDSFPDATNIKAADVRKGLAATAQQTSSSRAVSPALAHPSRLLASSRPPGFLLLLLLAAGWSEACWTHSMVGTGRNPLALTTGTPRKPLVGWLACSSAVRPHSPHGRGTERRSRASPVRHHDPLFKAEKLLC